MIAKELDPFYSNDKFQVAGRKAEEQMAFYLRRYFASSDEIYVINGLKIHANGESAQIDHLIIHPNGMLIIESKSVAEKIAVTADNQWIRKFGEKSTGMKSPIVQAEMQKMVFLQFAKNLDRFPNQFLGDNIQVLVAISDGGFIDWLDRMPISNVLKADQICDAAIKVIEFAAAGKPQEIIHEDALKQWFLDNTEQGKYMQIPTRNWVPWLAMFLSACNGYKDDLNTLESPDESLDDLWIHADVQTKRQIIHDLMSTNYQALWNATVTKRQKPFHWERVQNMRAMARKTGAFGR